MKKDQEDEVKEKNIQGCFKAVYSPWGSSGRHMAHDICKLVPQWRQKSGGQGDGQADITRVFHF